MPNKIKLLLSTKKNGSIIFQNKMLITLFDHKILLMNLHFMYSKVMQNLSKSPNKCVQKYTYAT